MCPFVLASFVNLRQWSCANITARLRDIISVISRLLSVPNENTIPLVFGATNAE